MNSAVCVVVVIGLQILLGKLGVFRGDMQYINLGFEETAHTLPTGKLEDTAHETGAEGE